MDTKRFTRTYMAIISMREFASTWSFSTYILFLLDHGLTLFDTTLLNFVFMSSNVLLDTPTGYIADRLSQKKAFLLGQVAWGIGMIIYGTGTTFAQFALAEFTAAIGSSLISGSLDSWLRNSIDEKEAYSTISKTNSVARLASIPSGILGGVIGGIYGLAWPWIISGCFCFIATAIAAYLLKDLPESQVTKNARRKSGKINAVRDIGQLVKQSITHPSLRFTLLVGLLSAFCFQPFNMMWSVILKELSGTTWWLGGMWAGIAAFTALGAYLSKGKVQSMNGKGVAIALLILGLPMVFTPFGGSAAAVVILILVHEIGRGALDPLLFAYANCHIENDVRSTMNSIRSTSKTLGSAIGLLVAGTLTFYLPPLSIWGLSATCLLILSLWAWRRKD